MTWMILKMKSQTTKAAIKSSVAKRFLNDFAVQCLFLATVTDPTQGKFNQDTLMSGLKILINTLAAVRRFDPAFAQDDNYVKLGEAMRTLSKSLSPKSHVVLKRASNLAKRIVKQLEEKNNENV